jgi:DME family drug/metabolite transporter
VQSSSEPQNIQNDTSESADGMNVRGNVLRARWMIILAAVLWSTNGFFAKAPWFEGWPGFVLAFWRAMFACAILLPLVRRPQWSWRLIPVTLIFAAMNYTYLTVMERYEASNAIWLQYTAPIWIITLGVVFLKENTSWADWVMVFFQMIGVLVILVPQFQNDTVWGLTLKILVGFTYALVVLSLRWMRDFEAAWIVGINHVMTCVVFLPFVLHVGIYPSEMVQWIALVAFGMLQMGLPYWLFAKSVKHLPGHEATGIVILEPILVPIWVYIAWGHLSSYESPSASTVVGAVFILFGLVVRFLNERKTVRQSESRG